MKKVVLLALAGFLSSQTLFAQNPAGGPPGGSRPGGPAPTAPAPVIPKGNGKITGVILDELSKKPVEFATVALLNKATGKTVDGSITDDKGKFSITKVAAGEYRLSVSFLGYENKFVENISISTGKSDVNVGTVSLKSDAKALKEVAVIGEKPLVEDKIDRMVYNAEKDISNVGGTAGDVLKKVPGLTVDLDGNVQLRGSSNIRVLINNKPSSIMAGSIADALRQIPSDQIKTVEVITSPGAKYDAEGTGGIINIITKKNNLQGLTGNVNLSYGTRNSNANGNVNFRKSKFGINTSMGTNLNNNPGEFDTRTDYLDNENIDKAVQQTTGRREGTFNFLQFGVDYDINKKNNISAGIRLNDPNFTFETDQTSFLTNNNVTNSFKRINSNQFEGNNYDLNFDYTKSFAKPQQELSFLALYSKSNRNNFIDIDQYLGETRENLMFKEKNLNKADNEEITFQTDYTQPFKNNKMLEIGAKAIIRNASSDITYTIARNGSTTFIPNNRLPNDNFGYDQDVISSYASYGFSLPKKFTVKLGGRYEYTAVGARFNQGPASIPDYGNFMPSVSVAHDLKNNQKLKANFTRRIQRPQLFFLNPYINRADSLNLQVGNPNLDAELTNSYEFSYSTFFKTGTSINASLYWRQTNNSIEQYQEIVDEKIVYTRFGNIGRNGTYGMSLFGNTKLFKKANVSGNINFFYTHLNSPTLDIDNGAFMYNANVNAGYTFNKGISAQMFGFFNSSRLTLQGKSGSFSYYNFSMKKEMFKKKGSISAGVDNPFAETFLLRTYAKTKDIDFNNDLRVYNRQFRISMNYQFGKMDFKNQPRRKKRISNDDAKSGGDGQ